MDLSVETRNEGTWGVVAVGGEVDMFTAPKLRETLIQTIDQGNERVAVELHNVTFMDSTGLGVLIGALRRIRERSGELRIVCTSRPVLRVLEVTGLHNVFSIHETLEEAMGAG